MEGECRKCGLTETVTDASKKNLKMDVYGCAY
jgi:hypothetical protein